MAEPKMTTGPEVGSLEEELLFEMKQELAERGGMSTTESEEENETND